MDRNASLPVKLATLAVALLLGGAAPADVLDGTQLSPVKRAEVVHLSRLWDAAHGSDGSDRARDGQPRFVGPLGAQGVTYKGWQYAVFYTARDRSDPKGFGDVVIARRDTTAARGGEWEYATLRGYSITSDDAHNRQTIAVSGDGAIHIAFDHHNAPVLNYARTNAGVADDPDGMVWADELFTYQPDLGADVLPTGTLVTYPSFKSLPGGDLVLYFRNGGSYGGDMRVLGYDAASARWSGLRNVSTRDGVFKGRDVTRGPYTSGGLQVGPDGSLHMTWVFRERPCEPPRADNMNERYCNHGLYYARSEDGGVSWYHADGRLIADTSKGETISVETAGPEVVDLPKALGPSNVSNTSAIDPATGNMHVLISHHRAGRDGGPKGDPVMHHYVGTPDGTWTGGPSGFTASDARLAFHGDTLLAFEGRRGAAIHRASRRDGFRRWKDMPIKGGSSRQMPSIEDGYATWDLSRLDQGIASLLWQTEAASGRKGDPSPIYVIDLKVLY